MDSAENEVVETMPGREITSIVSPENRSIQQLEDDVAYIERAGELHRKKMMAVLKMLYSGDIMAFSSKGKEPTCSISSAGAERIAPVLGISVTDVHGGQIPMQDKAGKYVIYEYIGTATYKGVSWPIRSVASTRERFFAVRYVDGQKRILPLEEVNLRDVQVAAWHGLSKAALGAMFGLRRLPMSAIVELGFDEASISKVDFKDTPSPATAGTGPVSSAGNVAEQGSPACPKCGLPMKLRNSAKGQFWGCSTYPKCKGTKQVSAGEAPAPPATLAAAPEDTDGYVPDMGGPTVAQLTRQITNIIGGRDGVANVDMTLAAMGIQSLAVLSPEELLRLLERLEGGK